MKFPLIILQILTKKLNKRLFNFNSTYILSRFSKSKVAQIDLKEFLQNKKPALAGLSLKIYEENNRCDNYTINRKWSKFNFFNEFQEKLNG